MAKSRKGFAKQNGRKKARLARKDTKMKKILKGRKDVKVKLTEQQLAQMQQEAKIDAPSDVENSDNEWTELGSCTTGGGLKITSDQKKIKPKTRRQVENKVCTKIPFENTHFYNTKYKLKTVQKDCSW